MIPAQPSATISGGSMRTLIGSLLALWVFAACSVDDDTSSPLAPLESKGSSASLVVTSVSCGDVIVSDLRLENDLTCPGSALTVSGSGININLNGHTISGSGSGVGIQISASQDVS